AAFGGGIQPVSTERAFFDNPARAAFDFWCAPRRNLRIFVGAFFPVEHPHTIGAGYHTVAAANAAVIIHLDQSIRAVIGGVNRTYIDTRRIFAVHTRAGDKHGFLERRVVLDEDVPSVVILRVVDGLAGVDAAVAADALFQIDDHRPIGAIDVGGVRLTNRVIDGAK